MDTQAVGDSGILGPCVKKLRTIRSIFYENGAIPLGSKSNGKGQAQNLRPKKGLLCSGRKPRNKRTRLLAINKANVLDLEICNRILSKDPVLHKHWITSTWNIRKNKLQKTKCAARISHQRAKWRDVKRNGSCRKYSKQDKPNPHTLVSLKQRQLSYDVSVNQSYRRTEEKMVLASHSVSSLLQSAIEKNDLELVSRLLEQQNMDSIDTFASGSKSPLLMAAKKFLQPRQCPEETQVQILKVMIRRTSPQCLNQRDSHEQSVLSYAVKSPSLEIVTALIEAGADISLPNFWGKTPLEGAAEAGHFSIVRKLILEGALVRSHRSKERMFHVAAANNHLPIIKLFLAIGCHGDLDANMQPWLRSHSKTWPAPIKNHIQTYRCSTKRLSYECRKVTWGKVKGRMDTYLGQAKVPHLLRKYFLLEYDHEYCD